MSRAHNYATLKLLGATSALTLFQVTAACSGKLTPHPIQFPSDASNDTDRLESDASSDVATEDCRMQDGQCNCCNGPAYFFDNDEDCIRGLFPWICLPRGNTGECDLRPDELVCYTRSLPDGGMEAVLTPQPYGPVPGYEYCDDGLTRRVVVAPKCP